MKQSLLLASLLTVAGVCLVTAEEKPKVDSRVPAKPGATKAAAVSPDEEAVRSLVDRLVKSYRERDAKDFAAAFTSEGEYIDAHGLTFHGPKAIEAEFAAFFKVHPETSIDVKLLSTRPIAKGVMTSDGTTHYRRSPTSPEMLGRCKLVFAKEGGDKWLIAGLREIEAVDMHSSHHDQVAQLEFLVGEWVDEGPQSHVHFSCRWDESGNYLIRDFSVQVAGARAWSGTQRIGYDPLSGHLKAWVFDSDGGYSDGYFHREGESWVLQSSGVTGDGHMASGTNAFTRIDDHRIAWDAVDRVVGGERIADTVKMTIVRKPPAPAPRAKQANRQKGSTP